MSERTKRSLKTIHAAAEDPSTINPRSLPTSRVSVDNAGNTFADMIREFAGEFSWVNPRYPIEYLNVMQNLSLANPDISQMVKNVIHLGNTGHKIIVECDTEAQEQRIIEEINSFGTQVFYRFGGLDGFINSCLGQVARSGAISVEWVPDPKLGGLEKVVFVPVCSIRFRLNRDTGDYEPYQRLNGNLGLGDDGGIHLNPYTYQYVALELLDNSPYAIPPILSALEAVMIQKDIVKNFRFVAKKLGLLGFTSFLLKAPQKSPGEKDDAYINRMKKYLADQGDLIRHNYRDGFFLGFMGSHEVTHHSLMGSAQGAAEIFKNIEEQVFSGLNSDPALHGRTYSTTETYAGVVYEKMLSILGNYQRPVKQVLEYGYKLHLNLKGLTYNNFYVEFAPSKSLSAERDETTYATKIQTLRQLFVDGIIDQNQYAQEAGYDAPALPGPREAEEAPPEEEVKANSYRFSKRGGHYIIRKKQSRPQPQEDATDEIFEALQVEVLALGCGCGQKHSFADRRSGKIAEFVRKYFRAVFPSLRNSRNEGVKAAADAAKKFPSTGDSELFADTIVDAFGKEFKSSLDASSLASKVKASVNTAYRYFRLQDAEPFKDGKFPIKPRFNLIDGKAVKFVRDSDNFYFGRYVTDERTKDALKRWLSSEWLRSGRSLRDPGELAKFRQRFGERVGKEDYKILRVVETSVSRSKNWGNIMSVDQSGGIEVSIAGPVDNVTCDWCEAMAGNPAKRIPTKTFKVAPVVDHIKEVSSQAPEDLPKLSPFLTNVLTPEEVVASGEEQLLKLGISLPPYHPSCRHRFIVSRFDD